MSSPPAGSVKIANIYYRYKPGLWFMLKVAGIYFGLYLPYRIYVGLSYPGGALQLPDFLKEFDFVVGLMKLYVLISEIALNFLGYATVSYGNVLKISGAGGVRVEYACLGVELWIALIALLFAYPIPVKGSTKLKTIACLFGIIGIFFLNVIRIVSIVLTNHHSYHMTTLIHDMFNYGVFILIFLFFLLWVRKFNLK